MKKLLEDKYLKVGLVAFLVIAASIGLFFILNHLKDIFSVIGFILRAFSPLVYGLILAYIMHPIVKLFENKVYKNIKNKTMKRNLSISSTLIIFVGIIVALIGYLIPQLLQSLQSLIINVPKYLEGTEKWLSNWLADTSISYNDMSTYILNFANNQLLPGVNSALNSLGNGIVGFIRVIFNFFLGMVFAVYILANTKSFSGGTKKVMYSLLSKEKVDGIIKEVLRINRVFVNFMIGKVLDSFCFVFTMTLLFTLICGFPYPLLIAFIIGLTDLIPYFGPYLGTIPSALLICLVDPVKAVIFIIFIVVLQQIDSNLVTPRIQSQTTGLPSFWVLFSITVFGALFGIVGLLIAVPCFTIIYEIATDYIDDRLKKKKMPTEVMEYVAKETKNKKVKE